MVEGKRKHIIGIGVESLIIGVDAMEVKVLTRDGGSIGKLIVGISGTECILIANSTPKRINIGSAPLWGG